MLAEVLDIGSLGNEFGDLPLDIELVPSEIAAVQLLLDAREHLDGLLVLDFFGVDTGADTGALRIRDPPAVVMIGCGG